MDFLTAVYTQDDQTITISLPDSNAAVKGDYYLYLSFTEPGEYEFELGVDLHVFDICNWS